MSNAMIAFLIVLGIFMCLWIVALTIVTILENLFMGKLHRYVRGINLLMRYGLIRLGGVDDKEAHRLVLEKQIVKTLLINDK